MNLLPYCHDSPAKWGLGMHDFLNHYKHSCAKRGINLSFKKNPCRKGGVPFTARRRPRLSIPSV